MNNSDEHPPSFFQAVAGLFRTFNSIFHDTIKLIALELQLAKKSLVWIIILSGLGVLFSVSAWFCLLATLVAFLIWLKLSWLVALIIVTSFNFLALIPLIFIVLRLSHYLTFPATRRQFGVYKKSHGKTNDETIAKENSTA